MKNKIENPFAFVSLNENFLLHLMHENSDIAQKNGISKKTDKSREMIQALYADDGEKYSIMPPTSIKINKAGRTWITERSILSKFPERLA